MVADTSVLVEFLRRNGDPAVRAALGRLLGSAGLAVCGIVAAELIQGTRPEERPAIDALLAEAEYLDFERADFEAAGSLGNRLRIKGLPAPLTDLLIAALCLRLDLHLYTLDRHFASVPGLKLHKP